MHFNLWLWKERVYLILMHVISKLHKRKGRKMMWNINVTVKSNGHWIQLCIFVACKMKSSRIPFPDQHGRRKSCEFSILKKIPWNLSQACVSIVIRAAGHRKRERQFESKKNGSINQRMQLLFLQRKIESTYSSFTRP